MPYPDWDEVPLVDIKKYEAGLGGYTRAVIGIRFRRNSLAQGWLRTDQDKALYEDNDCAQYRCDRIPVK